MTDLKVNYLYSLAILKMIYEQIKLLVFDSNPFNSGQIEL